MVSLQRLLVDKHLDLNVWGVGVDGAVRAGAHGRVGRTAE
jgi:hypothetical protein